MGDFHAWQKQVTEWEREETKKQDGWWNLNSTGSVARTYNLTTVSIRVCAKCGTRDGRIHRHHKGHEYLWARLLPSRYASRYIQFLSEDVVFLCDTNKCHLKIHKLYQPRLVELWPLLEKQNGRITYEQAERFRLKLVRCCVNWLKRKKKVKRVIKRRKVS